MHTENLEKAKFIKALVSGVSGDVAQGIIKCLEASSFDITVYKTCINKDSSWLYKDDNSFIVPRSDSAEYIPHIIKLIIEKNIDIFIPAVDSEILKISKNKKNIELQTGAKVLVGDYDKVKICDDKFKTYCFLKENNFFYPKTIIPKTKDSIDEFLSEVNFPIICKPRSGRGSSNLFYINDFKKAYSFLGNEEVVFQEIISGQEYTAGVYLGLDKEVKGNCILKRELKSGSTYKAERILSDKLEFIVSKISQKLGMNYVNIQFILNEGRVFPFEFNGRFSGTTGIIKKVFNGPEMYIREAFLNENIKKVKNSLKFKAMRFYEEIYCTEEQEAGLIKRSNLK